MSKFKVDDVITGNSKSDSRYALTDSRMTAKVIEVIPWNGNNDIRIEVTGHKSGYYIGRVFIVNSDYFDLISKQVELTMDDIARLAGIPVSELRIKK